MARTHPSGACPASRSSSACPPKLWRRWGPWPSLPAWPWRVWPSAPLARRSFSGGGGLRLDGLFRRGRRLGLGNGRVRGSIHHGESSLIELEMERPDLGHRYLQFGAQPPGRIDRRGRHIQVQRYLQLAKGAPFRHRFELVDRFAGLDFNRAFQPFAVLRQQQQVRKHRQRPHRDRLVLLGPRVHDDVVFTLYRACSSRMTRSCSSCSRTGRVRIGLTFPPEISLCGRHYSITQA